MWVRNHLGFSSILQAAYVNGCLCTIAMNLHRLASVRLNGLLNQIENFSWTTPHSTFPAVVFTAWFWDTYLNQCWDIANWTHKKNLSQIVIRIKTFWLTKIHFKMSSAKWWPVCLNLKVLLNGVYLMKDLCGFIRLAFIRFGYIQPNIYTLSFYRPTVKSLI